MYALKLRFRGKGQADWSETVLPNRIANKAHAEATAADLRSRGAIVKVIQVEEGR